MHPWACCRQQANCRQRQTILAWDMKTILIIEDDRAVAATYRHKLKEAGFRAEVAPDGLEGIKLVTSLRPDAVVLDLLMPRLDGIEVLKFIRSHPDLGNTPVVVFSNSYMTNLVESAWRAGADECLMKASTMPSQLIDTLRKVMSRPSRRQNQRPASANAPNQAGSMPPIDVLGTKPPPPAAPVPASPQPSAESPMRNTIPVTPVRPLGTPRSGGFTITYETPPPPSVPTPDTQFFVAKGGTAFLAKPDTEFHAQIRELFVTSSSARLETIRQLATGFIQATDDTLRAAHFDGLYRKIHALVGNAALAGCTPIAHYASTFEVLLTELRQEPVWLNSSTLNTLARAVECLDAMFTNVECLEVPLTATPSALVLEVDSEAARPIVAALEEARFKVTATEDPGYALGLLAATGFDLVVTGIHLQGTTGFEVHAQMQVLPQHAATPILFVTAQENFASHATDPVVAEHDLIAKPFQPIELTLKALANLHQRRLRLASPRQNAPVSAPASAAGGAASY